MSNEKKEKIHFSSNYLKKMSSTDLPVFSISNLDRNNKEPTDLIEVPAEILSKIENVEENNNNKCFIWIKIYGRKFLGLHEERPKRLPWQEYIWSFIGALIGIAAVAFIHFRLVEQ
jgi:hypothetical protein